MDYLIKPVAKVLNISPKEVKKFFVETQNPSFGDFTLTILMQKNFKEKKEQYFAKIKNALENTRFVEKVELKGLFVNIFLNPFYILNKKPKTTVKKERIMIEYSSPNSNKPLHLGHLRNTLLGDVLANMFERKSNVIRANLINDRGIAICKAMLGYKLFSEFKSPEEANMKPDHFVGYCYVLFAQKEKEDKELTKKAEKLLQDWEAGRKDAIMLWKKLNDWVLKGIKETYKNLGIKFDVYFYESKIYKKGKNIVLDAYKKGKVKKTDKGYIISLKKYNLPDKVLLRNDLTSIYITQDIYLAKYKFEKYNLDRSIYCIGSEQNLYMRQLFAVLKELGFKFADKLEHFSYGMIYLPSGKMKSREGNVVDLDNFIRDVEDKVEKIVKEKWPKISERELKKRTKAIAKAAINYFILKYDPKKDFIFDFDKSISFSGDSGPYLLYTYARINSLLKKANKFKFKKANRLRKTYLPEEKEILRLIAKKDYKFDFALEKRAPHVLVNYLLDVANRFNSMYAKHKLIVKKQLPQRYLFLEILKKFFEDVFKILDIKPLEKM